MIDEERQELEDEISTLNHIATLSAAKVTGFDSAIESVLDFASAYFRAGDDIRARELRDLAGNLKDDARRKQLVAEGTDASRAVREIRRRLDGASER